MRNSALNNGFKYSHLLGPWINLPEGNKLTIKKFAKNHLKKEDVVSDFLYFLNIDQEIHVFIWPKKVNVSLNAVSSYLLFHARKQNLEEDVVQLLVKDSKTLKWGRGGHNALSLLRGIKRQEIMGYVEEDNAKIAKLLGKSDGVLFDAINENQPRTNGPIIPELIDAFPLIQHFLEKRQEE
jgi:hypothetical protein